MMQSGQASRTRRVASAALSRAESQRGPGSSAQILSAARRIDMSARQAAWQSVVESAACSSVSCPSSAWTSSAAPASARAGLATSTNAAVTPALQRALTRRTNHASRARARCSPASSDAVDRGLAPRRPPTPADRKPISGARPFIRRRHRAAAAEVSSRLASSPTERTVSRRGRSGACELSSPRCLRNRLDRPTPNSIAMSLGAIDRHVAFP